MNKSGRTLKGSKRERWYLFAGGRRISTLYKSRKVGDYVDTKNNDYNAIVVSIMPPCIYAKTIKE